MCNSIEEGIGGSETCHIELAWRFAACGHDVVSYSPLRPDSCPEWRGVRWKDLAEADFNEPGLWVIFRSAPTLDRFQPRQNGRTVWLFLQDESPGGEVTEERASKVDRCIALCQWHKRHLEARHPNLAGKIVVSSNGLKTDLIQETEEDGRPERNPHRMIFASCPRRGLLPLCKIFARAREFVPDLTLAIFYGTDNMEKLADKLPHFKAMIPQLRAAADQPGVTWYGRVSQRQLYREMLVSGMWCYPNTFRETSCIQCMEMQAMGCVPITRPYAALGENVQWGSMIQGDPLDPLIQARYVAQICMWANGPQEEIRGPMMAWARDRFGWERVIDQLESLMPKEIVYT